MARPPRSFWRATASNPTLQCFLALVGAIGLDTAVASADYISLYRGDREALAGSLDRIQRTASVILAFVSAGVTGLASGAGYRGSNPCLPGTFLYIG
jgi:hypothetical protein